MSPCVVQATQCKRRKVVRLVTDRGEVIVTPEHRLLMRQRGATHYVWTCVADMKPGDQIRFLVEPWGDPSFEDGWFAGMIDGEGSVRSRKARGGGSELCITQLPGPVMDRAERYLSERGIAYRRDERGAGTGYGRMPSKLYLSRTDDVLKVLGRCRSTRFSGKPWWDGLGLPGKKVGAKLATVESIEAVGVREVIDLQTSTRTFIANGLVSHNSTLVEALLFWSCLTHPNRSSLVIAHTLKSSKVLFRMSRNFHRWVPLELQQRKRIDNIHEIEFDSGSRMQIEVQGDPRGYTAQDVHLSEFAFYEQPHETLVAIMQTLPRVVDSLCVIESTAKGVGNKFHKLWERASGMALDLEVPEDERGWTPIFIPWFQHDEYRIPLDSQMKPSATEFQFMQEHKVKIDQMKWRRWCISTNLDGDEAQFAQEYPATALEAFALSGRPAFDPQSVAFYTGKIAEAARKKAIPERMEIESDPPGVGKPQIIPFDRGRLRIFQEPKERHTYIVGADPSEGDPGSDPSPLAVLDQQSMDLVATWYGKAPPDLLACHAIDLARYYNEALIINEANNHGILFQETVQQLGYMSLFFRRVSEESVAGEVTDKPGFLSTRRTREHLFNTLRKYVRMRMGQLPCPHFVRQMQTLVYVEDKAEAQPGAEKDLLVAFALCLMAHRGSMANPLEPLPEAVIRSIASEVALLRERDPIAAEATCGRIGMTQEEVDRAEAVILEREMRQKRFGYGGMR